MNKLLKTELGIMTEITLEKMHFLYMEVANDTESQKQAWPKFEAQFPSLTGRKMYGLDYDERKTYRLCSLVLDSDNGENFGYKQFEFPGGSYLRLRLKYAPSELFTKIGPAYRFLLSHYGESIDWSLPIVEHYKAKDVLGSVVTRYYDSDCEIIMRF